MKTTIDNLVQEPCFMVRKRGTQLFIGEQYNNFGAKYTIGWVHISKAKCFDSETMADIVRELFEGAEVVHVLKKTTYVVEDEA